jgi:N-acetyl-anhydromuramyl-L-alanine amidase AmpD
MEKKWIGCPSSNFRKGRPFGLRPEAIVVHIMDGSFSAGQSVFLDASTHKSAHYGISHRGEIHQYVDESDTAYHAGIVVGPTWPLLKPNVNPNFYTIGIEHEGRPDDIWPEAQMDASGSLVGEIAARWSIPLDPLHVIRHHQIRASKTCPGNWVTIEAILQRAPSSVAPAKALTNSVQILRNVNLRARPNTNSPILRILLAPSKQAIAGFVTGERVRDNPFWYADTQGDYFWAGATDVPEPVTAI